MAGGLELSRRLMLAMLERGLPVATELLQPLVAGYFDDLLGWAAIGARTSESQVHRELVSGLGLPVGFKNGTDGSLSIACDAMRLGGAPAPSTSAWTAWAAGRWSRRPASRTPTWCCAAATAGRTMMRPAWPWRGRAWRGRASPRGSWSTAATPNSGKDPLRQPAAPRDVLDQRLAGDASRAVMLESHLFDGCQALSAELRYGVSVTDGAPGLERHRGDAARGGRAAA